MKPNPKVLAALKAKLKVATARAAKASSVYYSQANKDGAAVNALYRAYTKAKAELERKQHKGREAIRKARNVAQGAETEARKALRAEENKECAPPPKGKFIGYKKAYANVNLGKQRQIVDHDWNGKPIYEMRDTIRQYHVIVTLEVPASAQRQASGLDRGDKKCRCSVAKVLKMQWHKTGSTAHRGEVPASQEVHSWQDNQFFYAKGATVKPRRPYNKVQKVCASGIHFFMRRKDAEGY